MDQSSRVELRMLLKQKTLHAAIGLALSAVVLLTGCEKNTFVSSAIAAEHQMPPQEVVVVTAKAEPLHIATVLTGRTNSYTVAEVRPQVNGILQKRLFKEGQEVKAGDPLYQIDPAIYEAQLKSSEASLAQARAQLTQASADAKRSRELVKTNAVSKQSDDAAQAAMKTAQAAVKAAEAAVLTAKINLDYTKVRSPISGRVSRSEFTEGALLSAYQTTALTTVQQLDPIYVDVTQTADDMLRIQREIAAGTLKTDTQGAAEVELILSDGSKYAQKGKLTFFSPLYDSELPVSDLVYLPGGYPEFYLSRLSENRTMRQSILNYCQNGGHLFAECGGMMYLGEYITDTDGHSYPMCGFLPQGATMENMKLKLGYRKIFLNGQEYRGHEFHYSRIIPGQSPLPSIARVTNAKGMEVDTPVYRSGHVTASYIHFYWGDLPPFFI